MVGEILFQGGLLPNQICAIHDFSDDLLMLIVCFRIPSLVVSMDIIPSLLVFCIIVPYNYRFLCRTFFLPEVVVSFFSYVICVCVIVWYMVSHSLVFGVHFLA